MYETQKLISRKRGRYLIDDEKLFNCINNLSKEYHIDNYKLHKRVYETYKHNSSLYDIMPELLFNKTLLLALHIANKQYIKPVRLYKIIIIDLYYISRNGFIDYPELEKPILESIEKCINMGYLHNSLTPLLNGDVFLRNLYTMIYSQNMSKNDLIQNWSNIIYDCLYLFSKDEQSFNMVRNTIIRDLEKFREEKRLCNQK